MLSKIIEVSTQLPRAEQQVAAAVLANPEQTVDETIAQLARRSAVSEPTVVRFCRSLGADGFRQLKLEIARSLERELTVIHADIDGTEDLPSLIDKVVARAIMDLDGVKRVLDPEELARSVDRLENASTIEFWGLGASGIVATDAQNKFFRLGIPCVSYCDVPTLFQSAAIKRPGDVVIAISNSGQSRLLNEAASAAQQQQATLIAITAPGTALAEMADAVVAVMVNAADIRYTPRSSRLAHLLAVDLLQVSLAVKMGARASVPLRASKDALRRLSLDD